MPSSGMFMGMNMHELGMNRTSTEHEVTVIVDIKRMKYKACCDPRDPCKKVHILVSL